MLAQVLRFRDYRSDDGYRYPLPDWVIEKSLLAFHPAPRGLNALLLNELGSADLLIGHHAALARVYGVLIEDLNAFFTAVAAQFGKVAWSDGMARAIGQAIECPGLVREANETLRSWEKPGSKKAEAMVVYECFQRALVARHTDAWRPMNAVLKHAILLIEAARASWAVAKGGCDV
jgi:hypothetical protein